METWVNNPSVQLTNVNNCRLAHTVQVQTWKTQFKSWKVLYPRKKKEKVAPKEKRNIYSVYIF